MRGRPAPVYQRRTIVLSPLAASCEERGHHAHADPTSYLRVYPRFTPFLGADCPIGPSPDTSITVNRGYTRAHFLCYAGVVQPGTYR